MANEFRIKKGLIINGTENTILDVQGSSGQLFSVTDSLIGSLFSVNDISGTPIMEVFSDNTINLGTFGLEPFKIDNNNNIILGQVQTDNTVNSALFLDSNNNLVKRTLSEGSFGSSSTNNLPIFSTVLPNSIGTVFTTGVDRTVREIGNIIKSSQDGFYYHVITEVNQTNETQNVKLLKSSDLINWTDEGIILNESEDPYLVENNGTYYLYVEDKAPVTFRNIKLYTSTDLSTWSDQGVVLDYNSATWESQDVSSPIVYIENGTWYMYYEGRSSTQEGAIGLATSNDGVNWTKDVNNPIFSGTNLDSDILWADHIVPDDIIKINGFYYMMAHGNILPDGNPDNEWYNAVLISTDLVNWIDMLGTWTTRVNYTDESGYGTMVYNSEEYGIIASFVNEGNAPDQDQKKLIFGTFGTSQFFDLKEKSIKSKKAEFNYYVDIGENQTTLPTPFFNEDFSDSIGDFTTSGDLPWTRVTNEGNGDLFSMKSGLITHRESSILKLTKTTTSENTVLVFDYKTSTENNFDFLEIKIDGVDIKAYSGINSWTTSELFYIKGIGQHTIEWIFWRDNSVDGGTNEVWIDNVKLYNDFRPSLDIDGSITLGKDIYVNGTGSFDKLSVGGDFHVNGKHKAFDSNGRIIYQIEPNSMKLFGTNQNKSFDLVGGNSTSMEISNSSNVQNYLFDTNDSSDLPYLTLPNTNSEVYIGSDIPTSSGSGYSLTTSKGIYINGDIEGSANAYITGNVGIGTTDPSNKLEVKGDIKSNGDGSFTGNYWITNDSTSQSSFMWMDNNNVFRIQNGSLSNRAISLNGNGSGNVGIGTTNPQNKLHIQDSGTLALFKGDATSTNQTSSIEISNGYSTEFTKRIRVSAVAESSASNATGLALFTSPNSSETVERLRIKSNGNVGIGTDSPSERLEVNGNIVINEGNKIITFKGRNNYIINRNAGGALNLGFGDAMTFVMKGGTNGVEGFLWETHGGNALMALNDNGNLGVSGDVIAFSSSDRNLKENIININNPVEKLKLLNGVYFDWIEDKRHSFKGKDIGVIAQEVESILPEIVTTRENGVKAVQYHKLIPLTIEAIKEQDKKIEDLESRLEKLEKLIK